MERLRWILGCLATLFMVAFVAFFIFADRFRRSFGASPNAPWTLVLPLAVAGLLVSSTLFPSVRPVLHLTALVVVAVSIGAITLLRPAPLLALAWLGYAATWLMYYRSCLAIPGVISG